MGCDAERLYASCDSARWSTAGHEPGTATAVLCGTSAKESCARWSKGFAAIAAWMRMSSGGLKRESIDVVGSGWGCSPDIGGPPSSAARCHYHLSVRERDSRGATLPCQRQNGWRCDH